MTAADRSAGCFAADVVRAGLDPLTGRTLSFNHVPMAAWAGHLCDLLLAGALVDVAGTATPATLPPVVHPLVAAAWQHVQPRVPRPWRLIFGPQVVDINRSVADTRHWLVGVGVWRRHRTVFGWRHAATGAVAEPPPPVPAGDSPTRRAVLHALIAIAQVADHTAPHAYVDADAGPELTGALRTVLTTTSDLIAWKTFQPSLPRGGPL